MAALDLGAGVEQPFGCLIVQNRQAMQSMGRSMDLTGRRGGHTPFVQAGAETSDTGAEAVVRLFSADLTMKKIWCKLLWQKQITPLKLCMNSTCFGCNFQARYPIVTNSDRKQSFQQSFAIVQNWFEGFRFGSHIAAVFGDFFKSRAPAHYSCYWGPLWN